VERQRQDGHVVDALRFDEGERNTSRNAVKIRLQFLVELYQALFHILAHFESHDRETLAGARSRIDIFHTGNFPQQLLHRPGGALLDFFGAETGHRDQHVHHRNLNLRFLFPRQHDDRRCPEQHRGDDDQRREFGINEDTGNPAGQAEFAFGIG
jgi:hypothetical protein